MRLASYNVENLFERSKALNTPDWADGRDILAAQAEVNALFRKDTYSAADIARMQALLAVLGLAKADESAQAWLRQNRGHLRSGQPLQIKATGSRDWVGWVELKTEPVNAVAIENTARVIKLLGADILAVVEAESRPALVRFSAEMLPVVQAVPYDHLMLVDGNDDRGIDVGLMTRGCPIRSIVSHVDDLDAKGRPLFSRDCPEYEVSLPDGRSLWVLVNHFKSQGFGSKAANDARRRAQAQRAREIFDARIAGGAKLVALVGDLNDVPGSTALQPLLQDGALKDISLHPRFTSDGRAGTWRNGTAANKLDYIILSPDLWNAVTAAGVERRGVWGGTKGTLFPHLPEITSEVEAASDHAAIWVDLDLG